jgi:hypothetical protein
MSEHELSLDELVAQAAIELPAREMMQTITLTTGSNTATVGALNLAAAVNVASPGATATATGGDQAIAVLQNSGFIVTP